jgi:hypothetical protein
LYVLFHCFLLQKQPFCAKSCNLALIALGDSHHSQGGMKFATQNSPLLNCIEGGVLGAWFFEGLPRGVRGDALACRGHPYRFVYIIDKR